MIDITYIALAVIGAVCSAILFFGWTLCRISGLSEQELDERHCKDKHGAVDFQPPIL